MTDLIAIFNKLSPEAQKKLIQKAQQLAEKESASKVQQPTLPLGE